MVSHPSEPVSITAHENRTIRFLDNKTGAYGRLQRGVGGGLGWSVMQLSERALCVCSGKVVHSMVAHLDAVTCLTTDPKGTYLISGSEWDSAGHHFGTWIQTPQCCFTCLFVWFFSPALPPAGHDCSVRLWMLDNRTCVQEITAHRKKHDEAIHDVAFHPSQPFIASAGADALAKIFV